MIFKIDKLEVVFADIARPVATIVPTRVAHRVLARWYSKKMFIDIMPHSSKLVAEQDQ